MVLGLKQEPPEKLGLGQFGGVDGIQDRLDFLVRPLEFQQDLGAGEPFRFGHIVVAGGGHKAPDQFSCIFRGLIRGHGTKPFGHAQLIFHTGQLGGLGEHTR